MKNERGEPPYFVSTATGFKVAVALMGCALLVGSRKIVTKADAESPAPTVAAMKRPDLILVSSWYGDAHAGKTMANGFPFDPEAMTVAHRTMELGTKLDLCVGGESVRVTVADRGPYKKKHGQFTRDLDVSRGVARKLGMVECGIALVEVRRIP